MQLIELLRRIEQGEDFTEEDGYIQAIFIKGKPSKTTEVRLSRNPHDVEIGWYFIGSSIYLRERLAAFPQIQENFESFVKDMNW